MGRNRYGSGRVYKCGCSPGGHRVLTEYRQTTEPEPARGMPGGVCSNGLCLVQRYPPSVSCCGMLGVGLKKIGFDLCLGLDSG